MIPSEVFFCTFEHFVHVLSPELQLNQEEDDNLITLFGSWFVSFAAFKEVGNVSAWFKIRTTMSFTAPTS